MVEGWILLLLASLGAGLVGGVGAQWAAGVIALRRHRHDHHAAAVSEVTGLAAVSRPLTDVLMLCRCGDIRSVTLAGEWSLEQVQGLEVGDVTALPESDPGAATLTSGEIPAQN